MKLNQTKKVRQSNDLVESPYSQDFTAYEIKLFEIAGAGITEQDVANANQRINKRYSLTTRELANLLNTSASAISHEIEKTASKIMNKKIHLRKILDNGSVEFELINIIPYAKYKDGIFEYDFNYAIIPYIVEINKNFTEYQLHNLLSLRSAYAIKLYKLLYQYHKIKIRVFTLIELKEQFGISNKYARYNDLKKDVIDSSVNQINELTDLQVQYNEIKIGRKVVKLEFIFVLKKAKQIIIRDEQIEVEADDFNSVNQHDELLSLGISNQTKVLISKYELEKGQDYVEACISYAKRNAKTNLDKYLSDTLINGWADLEIKKAETKKKNVAAKIEKVKIEDDKKKQEKEQENIAKSEIEHNWNKLLDSEKQKFLNYSNFIINKYNSKLNSFVDLDQKLPLSIFAVTNDKFYDRNLEGYVKHIVKISLNVNDFIIKN